ncbi:glycerate kinase [Levilactobacillus koreensis JCM 16448]|uniref:Glycerate kinase n=1 Tax=Levilactobacillus koreensis TaxID=637971 RepID=A0AAC8UV93_9LACO|nr:glycerate kinase [Levilactobacillus koreensis]AKP64252.1 glycerate kinase [Levilactobacillus koreensis]KRK92327.1 glycerate kinase [Levilactobacillus koreensis JCM 16448]
MTRVLIASDSFKGSATSVEVANYIATGAHQADPTIQVTTVPIADGGEGTVASVLAAVGGEMREETVVGPLGQSVQAQWGMIDATTAIIEVAEAAGLNLAKSDLDPMLTTTYGVGQLVKVALDQGAQKIYIGLGGSATNDGGIGMAQALGGHFYDAKGQELAYGGNGMLQLDHVDLSTLDHRLRSATIVGLTDVANPLTGPQGASAVFGPQKGATKETIQILDRGLDHLNQVLMDYQKRSCGNLPGAGAAGGTGFGILTFLGGRLEPGIEQIMRLTKLDDRIAQADLVITGEGQIDGQSLMGKAPIGIARLAKKHQLPVILIAGSIGDNIQAVYNAGVDLVLSSTVTPMSVDQAIANVQPLLTQAGYTALKAFNLAAVTK